MANTYVVRKVPLWPVIKMSFVLFLVLGIIVGIFYALILSISGFFASALSGSLGGEFGFMKGLGFLLIPFFGILISVFGTIEVAICVLIYNLLASVVGGVELILEPAQHLGAAPAAQPKPTPPEGAQPPGEKTINGF